MDEKTSKVQLLKDKKKLRCHFPKSEFGVYGQACIKRLPIIDLSTLPKWASKEDLRYGSVDCNLLDLQQDRNFRGDPRGLQIYTTGQSLNKMEVFSLKIFLAHHYSYRNATSFFIPIQVFSVIIFKRGM